MPFCIGTEVGGGGVETMLSITESFLNTCEIDSKISDSRKPLFSKSISAFSQISFI